MFNSVPMSPCCDELAISCIWACTYCQCLPQECYAHVLLSNLAIVCVYAVEYLCCLFWLLWSFALLPLSMQREYYLHLSQCRAYVLYYSSYSPILVPPTLRSYSCSMPINNQHMLSSSRQYVLLTCPVCALSNRSPLPCTWDSQSMQPISLIVPYQPPHCLHSIRYLLLRYLPPCTSSSTCSIGIFKSLVLLLLYTSISLIILVFHPFTCGTAGLCMLHYLLSLLLYPPSIHLSMPMPCQIVHTSSIIRLPAITT